MQFVTRIYNNSGILDKNLTKIYRKHDFKKYYLPKHFNEICYPIYLYKKDLSKNKM